MDERVWITVVRRDETVAFGFAKVFDGTDGLRVLERQGRPVQNTLTVRRAFGQTPVLWCPRVRPNTRFMDNYGETITRCEST